MSRQLKYEEAKCSWFEYSKIIETSFRENPYYFLIHSLIHVPTDVLGIAIPKIFSQQTELLIDKDFVLEEPVYINKYHQMYFAGYDFSKLQIPKLKHVGYDLVSIPKTNYGEFNFAIPRIVGKKHVQDTFSKMIISTHQIKANKTIEDMFLQNFLPSSRTLLLGVFDGHGGTQCAKFFRDYFSQIFHQRLDFTLIQKFTDYCLKFNTDPMQVQIYTKYAISFYGAIRELEALWMKQVEIDNKLLGVGTCGCICAIHNNFLMVANLGDSLAFVITQNKITKKYHTSQLNFIHCTSYQQYHLKLRRSLTLDKIPIHPSITDIRNLYLSLHKTPKSTQKDCMLQDIDTDILRLMSQIKFTDQFNKLHQELFPEILDADLTYQQLMQILAMQLELPYENLMRLPARVNGSLMVTQSLGDIYLKNKREPYLFMEPSLCYNLLNTLDSTTVAMVIVSDGITNFLNIQEITDIILDTSFTYDLDKQKQDLTIEQMLNRNISQRINYQVLQKVSQERHLTIEQLLTHENKRQLFDDMTTQVVLFNQEF